MSQVAQSEVQAELARVLESRALSGSDQLKRFLQMVVSRTLDGQLDLLKDYTLGLDVFRRPSDYDPKIDPIVRVQARRLRGKLDEYYATEGADDPVIIGIPKGAYIPVFARRELLAHPLRLRFPRLAWMGAVLLLAGFGVVWFTMGPCPLEADLVRSVAVLPFEPFDEGGDGTRMAGEIGEVIATGLGKSNDLHVVSRTTASRYRQTKLSLPEIARQLQVRWVVEGGVVREGDQSYLKLRAIDALTDRKVWADVFNFAPNDLVAMSKRAASNIAGAITSEIRNKQPSPASNR